MKAISVLLSILIVSVFAQSEYKPKQSVRRGSGRITNGTAVGHRFMFPYQAGILSYNALNAPFWCGGSLISNQYIITAAHCLDKKVLSLVYLGTIDRTAAPVAKVDESGHIVHENYSSITVLDDIALLKLPVPIKISSSMKPIALEKDMSLTKWVNKDAIISGWGANTTGGTVQRYLHYAETIVLSNDECSAMWNKTIKPTQICQKVINNKGICQGDSGGPLAVKENNNEVLVGLTSYTISRVNQCEINIPRVFTRVSAYRSWICKHTENTVC